MKNMKKFASILLALVLAMALTVPAFADEPKPGSITINNAIPGETYSVYRIFDVVYSNLVTDQETGKVTGGNFSYKVTPEWKDFFTGTNAGTTYVTLGGADGDYATEIKMTEDTAPDFAAAAMAWAKSKNLTAQDSKSAVRPEGDTTSATVSVVFTGLDLGYYLVDSTTGTLCSLDTTTPNVTISEKNEKPTVDKEVLEDSNNKWQSVSDAQVGDTIPYKTTVTIGKGAENYVLHDKMQNSLSFKNDVVVKNGNTTLTQNTDYTLVTNGLKDECTFEIIFADSYIKKLTAGTELVVTYSATLNEKAVVYDQFNKNETWLNYGDTTNTTHETPHDETKTYTYAFDLIKTDSVTGKRLAGATFLLYDAATDGNIIPLVQVADKENTYQIAPKDENGQYATGAVATNENNAIDVPVTGKIVIEGLDADSGDTGDHYWLQEVKAPIGYNKLANRIEVKITRTMTSDTVTVSDTLNNMAQGDGVNNKIQWSGCVNVENSTGAEMPSTGGIGTTIFYTLGGLMVVAAGVLLVTKRRMHSNG